ncbi:MAG: TIGR02281 family clan AA aspartic protease [Hyphomicrobiales bacterium]|nr:TIGR02281 family clan AA aspartic protease [Hyphomicrobiales bacterium]
MAVWIGIVALFIAIIVLIAQNAGALLGMQGDQFVRVVAGLAILILLAGSLIGFYRDKVGETMRAVGIWALAFLALIILYSFRYEIILISERVAGELSPSGSQKDIVERGGERDQVRIKRDGGHFFARTMVNGAPVEMLVDTGASSVVLRPEDADMAGLDVRELRFNVPVSTANGTAYTARVRLEHVSIGGIRLRNVEALIAQPNSLNQSLLGMSFLSRLRSYEFSGDFLVLRI